MALDELLLESAVALGVCSLRWYGWKSPTVSLGYFQSEIPARLSRQFQGLEVVRRISGGGAILHHHELTYSVALGASHPLAREPRELYDRVHVAVIDVIRGAGAPVSLRGEADRALADQFLCFSRGDSFDVVCQGWKVLGSAQRRRRGAVLQHGSLLLRRSPHAPELPGLYDLVSLSISAGDLRRRLTIALADLVGSDLNFGAAPGVVLSSAEQVRLRELEEQQTRILVERRSGQ